jgi:hypothetical protein
MDLKLRAKDFFTNKFYIGGKVSINLMFAAAESPENSRAMSMGRIESICVY